ncbi:hypothetical protein GCK32_001948 [Trichostrongylus colubriformis]|uniref:Uncharacterized protein n=1 Tax=Trichostrongylus colubriformis TaxID=6319 RepID=A0AAN8F853_TRICO
MRESDDLEIKIISHLKFMRDVHNSVFRATVIVIKISKHSLPSCTVSFISCSCQGFNISWRMRERWLSASEPSMADSDGRAESNMEQSGPNYSVALQSPAVDSSSQTDSTQSSKVCSFVIKT